MENVKTTRRGLLGKCLMIPVGLFFVGGTLEGCSTPASTTTGTTGTSITPDDALNFLSGIAAQLGALLPQLVGLPASVSAQVGSVLTGVQNAAAALVTSVGTALSNPASSILGAGSAVQGFLTQVGIAVPAWLSSVVSDVATLAPTILQVLGLVGIALAPAPLLDPVSAGRTFRHLMAVRAH